MSRMKKLTMFQKMTLAYIIPFLCLSLIAVWYSYQNTKARLQEEFVRKSSESAAQVEQQITNRLKLAGDLADTISHNSEIIEFLNGPNFLAVPEFLDMYLRVATPIVNYTTAFSKSNDYSIQIYMEDTDIPPSWPFFFHSKDIKNQPAVEAFLEQNANQGWLNPDLGPIGLRVKNSDKSYVYAQKIYYAGRELLGIVMVRLTDKAIYSAIDSFDNDDPLLFFTHSGQILHSNLPLDASKESAVISGFESEKRDWLIDDNYLYIKSDIEPLQTTLYYRTSILTLKQSVREAVLNQLFIILTSISLVMIATYFLFKIIFSRLKNIVKVMNHVVKGHLDVRIPDRSNDEIGQLSKDFNLLIERNTELIHNLLQKERMQKDAQMQALQYQMNPHFIYNTIDIFRMKLVAEDRFETAESLADFGKMLRYNLNDQSMYATVLEEIEFVQKYINLQKLGRGEFVQFHYEVPEGLLSFRILKLMIQPIVENSIKYGYEKNRDVLEIGLNGYVLNDVLYLKIKDNGAGMNMERLNEVKRSLKGQTSSARQAGNGGSIGLININNRVMLYYGDSYYLEVDSVQGEYTEVTIRIPYVRKEQKDV